MRSTKDKSLKIVSVIIIVLALAGVCFGAYVGGRAWTNKLPLDNDYSEIFVPHNYSVETDESGVLKVIKINDTHFLNGKTEKDVKTLQGIKTALDGADADFIVLAGDLVEGFSLNPAYDKEQAIKSICELMESYGIPWTFTPGNNDGEVDGSNKDVIAYMLRYEHFMAGNEEGLYGDLQFYVDVTHNGERVHTLAFMDSGMRKPKITGSYDHFRENQVAHLKEEVARRGVRTSLFMHMQTPAFADAYEKGMPYGNMPKRLSDSYSSIPKNAIFDEMLSAVDLLTLVSCGHQHGNDLCSLYEGRYYQLSSPSGYSAWMPEGVNPSVTLTTINTLAPSIDGLYAFEKIYY
ncbi:MAG: metallophosphoesterase [Clostridia bacterium]|nr:metallophosphoesterase [Clostridia bacterium]